MTASNELLVVHLEEGIGGGEKLWMENNLGREGGRERERARARGGGRGGEGQRGREGGRETKGERG